MFIKNSAGFGKAPDEYVYIHFPAAAGPDTGYWDGNDFILLGRVLPSQLLNRSAYEFWVRAGVERPGEQKQEHGPGAGLWSLDGTRATPVFEYTHMTGQDHTFYSPGLKRYILPNYGFVDPR